MLKTLILKNLFVLPDKTNIKLWGSFIAWPFSLPLPPIFGTFTAFLGLQPRKFNFYGDHMKS